MIPLKTQKEIALMKEGGHRLREVLETLIRAATPGVSEQELDRLAEKEILARGGRPSFKMVAGYHWTTCLTVNDKVVHGIPGSRTLKNGDILGIDVGMFYQGFHTDLAATVKIGREKNPEAETFLNSGREALALALKEVRVGHYIGDISLAIEKKIKGDGYRVVKTLVGHGVGAKLHEEPNIPGYLRGKKEKTPRLVAGMTLAIEVIYNQGSEKLVIEDDGWTISTWDGKISGLFEETVAVTTDGPLILTR